MKSFLVASAVAFAVGVLALPPVLATGERAGTGTMGSKDLDQASPAELDIIRQGPITVAGWNTAAGWQRDCITKNGATPLPHPYGDGRIGYGAQYGASLQNQSSIDECWRLGRVVQETYFFDHASFFSQTFPIPGLGPAVTRLRES